MRFNKNELTRLAAQPSHKFEKEGVLFIKEKQDGFFLRKSESKLLLYLFLLLHLAFCKFACFPFCNLIGHSNLLII